MISHLRGVAHRVLPGQLVIDVGGVGFSVLVPDTLSARLREGEELQVATRLVVRPEQMVLFGFGSNQERELFTMLTSISGLGPKSALSILSGMSASELAAAVLEEDVKTLCAVKGIGKKTARRIIVELQEKIAGLAPDELPEGGDRELEAVSILQSLGCTEQEAREAVATAIDSLPLEAPADRLVMEAMRVLGSH